jgi:integrase/recombinase XerC/integrase/recombinase XerD
MTDLQKTDSAQMVTTKPAFDMETAGRVIEEFLADQGVRPSSRRTYKAALRSFFRWLIAEELTGEQLRPRHINAFVDHLKTAPQKKPIKNGEPVIIEGAKQGRSALTICNYLTALRRFFAWMESEGRGANVARNVKGLKQGDEFRKRPLSVEDARRLMEHAETLPLRERALINLLIRTGIRTIEAARADVADISRVSGVRVLMVHGKGRDDKSELVELSERTYQILSEYLETRQGAELSEPLFLSGHRGSKTGRLSTRAISQIAKDALKAAGVAIGHDSHFYTAHSLRHTFATQLMRLDVPAEDVQRAMRHASSDTTKRYTRTVEKELMLKRGVSGRLDTVF